MWGPTRPIAALCLLACAATACTRPSLEALAELPVRSGPQTDRPYSQSDSGAPLRGTAVAIQVAPAQ